MMRGASSLLLILLLLGAADIASADGPQLLARRCLNCHNANTKLGNLSLVSRNDASRVLQGRLLERVERGEMPPGGGLPPEERAEIKRWLAEGAPWEGTLQVATRPRAGRDWWSLQPLKPLPTSAASPASIDTFIQAKLREKALQLSAPADRRTLIRRVTFDLTGLPPTPEAIAAFEKDRSPNAYAALVDRLLASPAYGERWGRHWLDVIRYGESHGYEQNHVRPNAWPFRDYVIASFQNDLPFNQFILQQLAGDVLAKDDPKVAVATGFLVAGPHDTVGNSNEAATRQQRADDHDDMVNATASAFLGLTVNCARCHDHKFDPIQQADYYRIASVFAGVYHGERDIATPAQREAYRLQTEPLRAQIAAHKKQLEALTAEANPKRADAEAALKARLRAPVSPFGTEESFPARTARFVRLVAPLGFPGGLDEFELFQADGRNLAPSAKVTVSSTRIADGNPDAYHPRFLVDGAFNKRWFPEGSGPASITFELPTEQTLTKVAWSTDRLRAFQGRFQQNTVSVYQLETSQDGNTWTPLAAGDTRLPHRKETLDRLLTLEALSLSQRDAFLAAEAGTKQLEADLKKIPALPLAYAGKMDAPKEPVYLLKGGNVMQRGDAMLPASLSMVPKTLLPGFELPVDAPEAERRLAFAKWIADDRNPLTPRVIANRLWHYHFGRGLVGTPSDFGYNGERPTHPELLDYLAQRLITNGWRLKSLHREILLSATYQQASAENPEAAKVDAEARLLWRFPPQRLQAEALRDSMLAVAGVLDPKAGGPSFRLYKYTVDNVATYFPVDKFGPETYRRSVYAESARSIRAELLSVFDCPDSSLPEPRRVVTTSPLQALSLLNHSFTTDMAGFLAKRLQAQPSRKRIPFAFDLAFGRKPLPEEKTKAEALIKQHGLPAFARALFNANEFVYVY